MNELSAKIETLLFLSTKPLNLARIAAILEVSSQEVDAAIGVLSAERNVVTSGVHVLRGADGVMLVSNPEFAGLAAKLSKEDVEPELTRPSLETLTIIAYRGPITKPEIETIRGVNCSLILRNLLMRGLIVEDEDMVKLQPVYRLSNDALRYLGLHSAEELPEYDELHANARVDQLLQTLTDAESI